VLNMCDGQGDHPGTTRAGQQLQFTPYLEYHAGPTCLRTLCQQSLPATDCDLPHEANRVLVLRLIYWRR
jgi:hypothetical protein